MIIEKIKARLLAQFIYYPYICQKTTKEDYGTYYYERASHDMAHA